MSEIQEKPETGVREIFESGKYEEYIAAMSKFPHYSINNCILIVSQCPEASHVCGFRKWQTDFKRVVNRNEHGIMIIAPITYKAGAGLRGILIYHSFCSCNKDYG